MLPYHFSGLSLVQIAGTGFDWSIMDPFNDVLNLYHDLGSAERAHTVVRAAESDGGGSSDLFLFQVDAAAVILGFKGRVHKFT